MPTCVLQLPDIPHACPYLAGETASHEHYLIEGEGPRLADALIDRGFRAFGSYWFRPGPACCGACLPLRVDVARFRPSKSQRRARRRADRAGVVASVAPPAFSEEKYALYREHKLRFADGEALGREEFFAGFYGDDPLALEAEYRLGDGGALVACGLLRATPSNLSSTYFFYGAAGARLGLGTSSVVREIEFARDRGARHLHLGFFLAANRWMRYKASFRPCEVLLGDDGTWTPLRDEAGRWLLDPDGLRRRPRALLWDSEPQAFDQDGTTLFLPSLEAAHAAPPPPPKHD